MLIFILKVLSQNSLDLINEVESKLKLNNPTEAFKLIKQIKETQSISFKITHAKYLYLTGEYEELVNKYSKESDIGIKSLVEKANRAIKLIGKNFTPNLSHLNEIESIYKESFMCKRLANYLIQIYIQNNQFSKAKDIAEMIYSSYPLDRDIKKCYGHVLCLTPFYNKGILILKELQIKEGNLFDLILQKFNSAKTNESYKEIIDQIRNIELYSDFKPSVFYYFKFYTLYFNYVKNMIGQNRSATKEAYELNEVIQENTTFYLLGKSLLLENKTNELNNVINNPKFTDQFKKSALKTEKEMKEKVFQEEEAKRKEKQKEEERKREREEAERRRRTHKHDISGYYEALGIKHTATKDEINRAFKKKCLEINPEKYKNDKDEYERRLKLQMKVNKAKDVLSNEKTRKLYDQGIDNETPQSNDFYSHHNSKGNRVHDVEDIFSAFFGNNDFGGRRSTRRTYYYYYG
ncbi:dnaJ subfamily B member 6 isoform X2 like protein [Tubulinosema ratisbonensis]|uniref:DnaJ subfamily B member 6 isoform X2 like protein n=1 Tax=Tubulinosema ratisbonensis TaxID=291195 RepID=A0A437APZ5_9MICR|nr:dnaJ subfamily B member 6 isoform X2 like protein [Tubulinosema ratisbonensis]